MMKSIMKTIVSRVQTIARTSSCQLGLLFFFDKNFFKFTKIKVNKNR